jgi:hypothetical protein
MDHHLGTATTTTTTTPPQRNLVPTTSTRAEPITESYVRVADGRRSENQDFDAGRRRDNLRNDLCSLILFKSVTFFGHQEKSFR